jgi:lysozyme family protein
MEFDHALAHVLREEGGYVNHPRDPGGATNMGITQRTARAHGYKGSMRRLPLSVAETIYREAYWDQCRCDELPPALRLPVFDAAVNSGPVRSIRWLQESVQVRATGVLQDALITALGILTPREIAATRERLLARRMAFLRGLSTWKVFGRGWANRLERVRGAG